MPSSALQFGLNISTAAGGSSDPIADARRAEDLGFDFVSASDHPCGDHPTYETWTMLSWIASATSRIRLATRVLGVPYRSPALVAKMAESFNRLSGNRLILGLGGGASDSEFRAFGMRVPTPREKVDGLEEAIRITRGLWSEAQFSFDGRHHSVTDADLEPKPDGRIPIWLGTFGDRALDVTGRLADGWIPSFGYAPPDEVTVMREKMLAAAVRAGRDPQDITCAYNVEVRLGQQTELDPSVVSGSSGEVAARLNDFVKIGFSTFNFVLSAPGIDEQAELLAREVLAELRASV